MKVLVVATPASQASIFARVFMALRERGHDLHVVTEGENGCPARRSDSWRESILTLRGLRDYSRYLHPPFGASEKLRKRALLSLVETLSAGAVDRIATTCPSGGEILTNDDFGRLAFGLGVRGVEQVEAVFRMAETLVPSDPAYESFIRAERPDVVLVTPLVRFGSGQADIVKSCRALSVPVALAVPALETLSAYGLIHVCPDSVLVWNTRQAQEASTLHDVSTDCITITGAPRFDAFYAMSVAQSREEFCRQHGLDARRPILTYLCSSDFVHRDEAAVVTEWIAQVRSHHRLRDCGIVIRPHPRATRTWKSVDIGQWERVTCIKAKGGDSAPSLHAALSHAFAAVALNTTAALEAGILGKPVFTFVTRQTASGQTGTLYFDHLLDRNGGHVTAATDFAAHLQQLAGAMTNPPAAATIRAFANVFVRTGAVAVPAAQRMVDAIEDLARRRGRSE